MHGEIGQTQFLPKNILAYGTGNLDVAANALSSTANFLKAHGWQAGAGYQPGEANFAVIQAWNAAQVDQRAAARLTEARAPRRADASVVQAASGGTPGKCRRSYPASRTG
jgi:membrane-bound lytic murein transglycosylase B